MYDIPATTLNWEIFKSYLLKNSGTVGDDVKVSYITDSNREFRIESQTDFQIALYAFRRKARMGDIVNLKLDRISEQPTSKNSRHSNDAETQFDTNETASIVSSTCCNANSPPEWFITYMNKFKKNFTEEITAVISSSVSNIKPHTVSQPPCYHSRKSKAENSKRRKLPLLTGDGPHESPKEVIKSIKLEGKLEHKLEKLENKTKKLKEKKLALFSKSSDSDVGNTSIKRRTIVPCENDDMLEMDATPVNTQEMVPHMLGGEIYLHQWKVINSGKLPWTSETTLMFTWGSKALRALDTIASVPYLKPGETGTIAVRLQIPNQPGQYECYFHFHHKNRRFGHWLGCQVIVDPFDLKGNKSVLETSYVTCDPSPRKLSTPSEYLGNISNPVTCYGDIWQGTSVATDSCPYNPTYTYLEANHGEEELPSSKSELHNEQKEPSLVAVETVVRELSSRVEDIKLQDPTDTNCSSDSDNQSIISLSDSNSSKGIPSEYVVVPIPNCFQLEEATTTKKTVFNVEPEAVVKIIDAELPIKENLDNFDDNNNEDTKRNIKKEVGTGDDEISNCSQKSDMVMITLPEINQDSEECACVVVDGQKVMIPKKMIKSEYLHKAEKEENPIPEMQSRSGSSSLYPNLIQEKEHSSEQESNKNSDNKTQNDSQYQPLNLEENDFNSHCSAAGSCFSDETAERTKRLFIFPQTCPGYEVIEGNDVTTLEGDGYTWSKSETHYAFCAENAREPLVPTISNPVTIPTTTNNNPFTAETLAHVPNYQQTPPEERRAPSEADIQIKFQTREENLQFPPEEPVRNISLEASAHQEPMLEPSAPIQDRRSEGTETSPTVVHILPETLVSGAVNAVSSVARSVISRIVPQGAPGRWENGHWISTNPNTPREANLHALAEMGFWNRDLNATLLARYNDDLSRVVAELVQ